MSIEERQKMLERRRQNRKQETDQQKERRRERDRIRRQKQKETSPGLSTEYSQGSNPELHTNFSSIRRRLRLTDLRRQARAIMHRSANELASANCTSTDSLQAEGNRSIP
ncbi:hypothetical protein ACHQM5_002577 [Ranunculus cassubicifolius]